MTRYPVINEADRFEFLPREEKISSVLCWRKRVDSFAPQIGRNTDVEISREEDKNYVSYSSALQIIAQSLEWIDACAPVIRSFIQRVTSQIIVQRDHTRTEYYGLSSYNNPGSIRIVNSELLGQSFCVVASAVIHESIHQYLFLLEQAYGYFLSPNLFYSEKKVQSPWTGSVIYCNNICHAAAVWYGLFHYWGTVNECLYGDERSIAETQRIKIQSGFSGEHYQTLLSMFSAHDERFAVTLLTHLHHQMIRGDLVQ